jgi:hypothetical protein
LERNPLDHPETLTILSDVVWSKVTLVNGGNHSYPTLGLRLIHTIVALPLKELHLKYWRDFNWTGPVGDLIVSHLDDDVFYFNQPNLFWVPSIVNDWMRKDFTFNPSTNGQKHRSTFKVMGRTLNTYFYESKEMVHHERTSNLDILKIHAISAFARQFIFDHAILIPNGYDSHYIDLKTLMACATPKMLAKVAAEVKHVKKGYLVQTVPYADLTSEEKAFFDSSMSKSTIANDPSQDSIVRYTGNHGATFIFLVETADFITFIKDFQGEIDRRKGYVRMEKQNLHLIILGREKGQGKVDGKKGRHFNDVIIVSLNLF